MGYADSANKITGTYFFGGAGMNGDYIPDMIKSFKEAGISEPFAVDRKFYSAGSYPNAVIGVPLLRGDIPEFAKFQQSAFGDYSSRLENRGSGNGQLNLVGYSYGSEVAATEAMMLTNSGNRVNNLVLIGSPINNNFLDSLKKNPLISNVIVVNLNQHGDPLYAGMPFSTLVQSVKTLGEQQAKGTVIFSMRLQEHKAMSVVEN